MTRTRKKFPFFLWHRRLGIIALVLVLILSITGIILNHTESFKLDETTVESELLLSWYGLNPEGKPISFKFKDIIISQWDEQLFFNTDIISHNSQLLRGATRLNDIIIVAFDNTILLLETNGSIIEQARINIDNIINIGTDGKHVYVKNSAGDIFVSDEQIINWKKTQHNHIVWATATKPDHALRQQLKQVYRGQGLSLERVILDLHSGRLFNQRWGIYIMDASAVIMIWLGLSGTWIWWSRNKKIRTKRHYQKHHQSVHTRKD
ncbi:MAG: PepSY domain-containing protein [Gammaproteobacteria bacterium]|nr:PepSY domain-containing protein [Gammaproteobacteria bacterium]